MSRLRDNEIDFESAVSEAAGKLGLAPLFVEKDYWVTQVLRALHDRHASAFMFKGGTSLSKGYGLIERFSEDVDILIHPAKGDSTKSREQLLLKMTTDVAEELAVDWTEAREPGRGRHPNRADLVIYPRLIQSSIAVPIENRGALLETGYAGGDWPVERVTLTPLLCEPLGIDPTEFSDTGAFEVRALKPARTLLEKLSLLHHVANEYGRGNTAIDNRCGRHYYDIHRLLDHPPTRADLESRSSFERILSDIAEISTAHYDGWIDRPEGGYAHSLAFSPPRDSDVRQWLEQRYIEAAELMPAKVSGHWPTFGQVLKRVGEHAALL